VLEVTLMLTTHGTNILTPANNREPISNETYPWLAANQSPRLPTGRTAAGAGTATRLSTRSR
jgi:hypothetical protein